MAQKIQLRRDTLANFIANAVILSVGEPTYTTDTQEYRIGDGVTAFVSLPVFSKLSDLAEIQLEVDSLDNSVVNLRGEYDIFVASGVAAKVNQVLNNTNLTDNIELNNQIRASDAALDARIFTLENAPPAPVLTTIDGGNAAG